ncbi:hypothetical protein [Mycobacteroides abscessus]|uniref:hypothetical protein n=1 Tax=Mycobacteroides abscessus TaxID=36809 RepID=UPI000926BB7D|nr:hypothetical protein [Mycobacteroides abscessus]SHQ53480.1 Bacteriophage protein [Mycobacteroides abscessus subsp. abscessus]
MSELLDRAKASLEGVDPYVPWDVDVFSDGSWAVYAADSLKATSTDYRIAKFIAAARRLVPELIAEIERLERVLQGRVRELERERDDHLETAEIMRRTRERAERLQAEIDAMKKQASVSCCTLSYEEGFSQCLSCQRKLR